MRIITLLVFITAIIFSIQARAEIPVSVSISLENQEHLTESIKSCIEEKIKVISDYDVVFVKYTESFLDVYVVVNNSAAVIVDSKYLTTRPSIHTLVLGRTSKTLIFGSICDTAAVAWSDYTNRSRSGSLLCHQR